MAIIRTESDPDEVHVICKSAQAQAVNEHHISCAPADDLERNLFIC